MILLGLRTGNVYKDGTNFCKIDECCEELSYLQSMDAKFLAERRKGNQRRCKRCSKCNQI